MSFSFTFTCLHCWRLIYWLTFTTANFFQEPPEKLKKLYGDEHLNDFLDAPLSILLCGKKLPDTSEVILDVVITMNDKDDSVILFYKIVTDPITPENMRKNILISTMIDSPVTSLYHALTAVFMPILMKV